MKPFGKLFRTVVLAAGLLLFTCGDTAFNTVYGQNLKTRVVVIRNDSLKDDKGNYTSIQLQRSLNEAIKILFAADTGAKGISTIINPNDKIGLKVQCYGGDKDNVTHPELVDAILYFFRQNRIPDNNIIVWDDELVSFEKSGHRISKSDKGIRYLVNRHKKPRDGGIEMIAGYGDEVTIGKAKAKLSNIITKETTVTISMPVLKTHKFKDNLGVNCALLNMYGAIEVNDENIKTLYDNECDTAVADLYNQPQIKNKIKLIVCDAITPLYNGGPMDDKRYHYNFNGIIVGTDPVAVDTVGQEILQQLRDEKLGKDAPKLKTKYLETAASDKYKLGTNELKWIELVEKTLK
jgi:uncharacterized protein (DUF362 family)